jgi:hypothetical protein
MPLLSREIELYVLIFFGTTSMTCFVSCLSKLVVPFMA